LTISRSAAERTLCRAQHQLTLDSQIILAKHRAISECPADNLSNFQKHFVITPKFLTIFDFISIWRIGGGQGACGGESAAVSAEQLYPGAAFVNYSHPV
jgi:hypothetical protein